MLSWAKMFVGCTTLKICQKNRLMLSFHIKFLTQFQSKLTWSALRLGVSYHAKFALY